MRVINKIVKKKKHILFSKIKFHIFYIDLKI